MALDVSNLVRKDRAFTVTTGLNSLGNTEHDYLLLKNPSSNDQDILVTHFLVGVDATSVRSIWRAYANPTITSDGTGLTETNTRISASPPAAKAEAFMDPTISARGNILNMAIAPVNTPSRGVSRFYWIAPGNSLLVTIENAVSNAETFADIYWIEDA